MVPSVVAACKVAMDTSFCPENHFPAPLAEAPDLPGPSTVSEFNLFKPALC